MVSFGGSEVNLAFVVGEDHLADVVGRLHRRFFNAADAALSARYFRSVGYFVSGAGLADIASRARQPDATPLRLETFDDARFPLVSAVAPHLRADRLDAVFEFGLDILFDAMQRDADAIAQAKKAR